MMVRVIYLFQYIFVEAESQRMENIVCTMAFINSRKQVVKGSQKLATATAVRAW